MNELKKRGKHMRTEIEDASTRLANYIRKTPVISFGSGAWRLDAHLVLKLEQLQHTGSFKVRGAFNRILSHQRQKFRHQQCRCCGRDNRAGRLPTLEIRSRVPDHSREMSRDGQVLR